MTDSSKDCLTCKFIGVGTFSAISIYASMLRKTVPKSDKGQRIFLAIFAVGSGGIAILRAVTWMVKRIIIIIISIIRVYFVSVVVSFKC